MTEIDNRIDRRTLLFGTLAAGVQAATADTSPQTFSQWLAASAQAREAALASCLDRIRALDGDIQAWVQVLPQSPTGKGKLLGIPFGVKDIIETRGLATEYGSPIYKGRIGTADAAIVRRLRERGGVLLGKTHSTAFAYIDPAPTHKPRDLALRLAWCRLRSARKRAARCCGRRRTAA
jgi:Asp-tRNA(Asn)/Glu-tRNA(Gln) amidotransferase A subunit family amidase